MIDVFDDGPEHAREVAEIQRAAFGRDDEATIVERVRTAGAASISLVAGLEGRLVGHVLLSAVTIEASAPTPPELRGLGLGPIAVRPEVQRRGVGIELTRVALERARLLGYAFVVVLGHPSYYPRFGFVPASRFGLRFPAEGIPDEAFMALELRKGALGGHAGVVRYAPAFG